MAHYKGVNMANNFTSLWTMAFGLVSRLLNMPLPIYLGSYALSTLDIILGTIGILAAFAFIRALLRSSFTLAGNSLIAEREHAKKVTWANNHLNNLAKQTANKSTEITVNK